MHSKKRHGILAAAAGLAVSLVLGAVVAQADGDGHIASAGNGGDNSLTVEISASSEIEPDAYDYEQLASDKDNVDLVVDVYQLATATEDSAYLMYHYTVAGDYADIASDFVDENGEFTSTITTDDWKKLASAAVEKASLTSEGTVNVGDTLSNLQPGIYLVLAHGRDVTDGLRARTNDGLYEYIFAPQLIAVPNSAQAVNGAYGTATEYGGPTNKDVTMILKPTKNPLYGSVTINKVVNGFSGEAATFVFHLNGTTPDGDIYDNYASITYNGTPESATTTVTHIPAGTELSIEEVYSGARYTYKSGNGNVTIVADDADPESETGLADGSKAVEIEFENDRGNTTTGGNGIENKFTFTNADEVWPKPTAKPESAYKEKN